MNDEQKQAVLAAIVKILSRRAILMIGLILDFVLFGWASVEPSWARLIGAGGFGLLVLIAHWLPVG